MGNICQENINKSELVSEESNVQVNSTLSASNYDGPLSASARSTSLPTLPKHFEQSIIRNMPLTTEEISGIKLDPYYLKNKSMTYSGQWKNRKPHGKGVVFFDNGAYFDGYFDNGQAKCRDGLFIYPDGSFYRGQISNSQINGEGIFQSASKSVIYAGQWKQNKPHGYGKETFSDGNRYEGDFKDGYKEGLGAFFWADGGFYEGQFKRGYMQGNGYYKKNNSEYRGYFEKNMKASKNGVMITELGKYQGPFFNGQMHGVGIFYWDDKKIYRGQFSKNKLHGQGMIEYPNGQKVFGQWSNGENIIIDKFQGEETR